MKYTSDSFENLYNKLQEGKGKYKGVDPEDLNEYKAKNIFKRETLVKSILNKKDGVPYGRLEIVLKTLK